MMRRTPTPTLFPEPTLFRSRNHQVHRGTLRHGVSARRVLANYFAGSHRVTGLLGDGPPRKFRSRDGCGRSVLSQPLHVGHDRHRTPLTTNHAHISTSASGLP